MSCKVILWDGTTLLSLFTYHGGLHFSGIQLVGRYTNTWIQYIDLGGGFKYLLFSPLLGEEICFKGVETTNLRCVVCCCVFFTLINHQIAKRWVGPEVRFVLHPGSQRSTSFVKETGPWLPWLFRVKKAFRGWKCYPDVWGIVFFYNHSFRKTLVNNRDSIWKV